VYETIVHPTDGSMCSIRALEHAISLAKEYDAAFHIINVMEGANLPMQDESPSLVTGLAVAGESILERAEKRARDAALYPVSTHLRLGGRLSADSRHHRRTERRPHRAGIHGRSAPERFPLGSTTERTLRRASVPLLAVEPLDSGG
jgi:nucleotide-binding universal stress UspA family protein